MASNGKQGALSASDLYSLEEYHRERADFRARVIEHKKNRQVALGPFTTLYFEDRLTIRYQVQEMLRIERIFEREAIEEELAAYNPLIPDGTNFKATFMIEIPDVDERRKKLAVLTGIEDHVYVKVGDTDMIIAFADEDLERTTDDKTSAVHFVRFELDDARREALKRGASLKFGCDHPEYPYETELNADQRAALVADLD